MKLSKNQAKQVGEYMKWKIKASIKDKLILSELATCCAIFSKFEDQIPGTTMMNSMFELIDNLESDVALGAITAVHVRYANIKLKVAKKKALEDSKNIVDSEKEVKVFN